MDDKVFGFWMCSCCGNVFDGDIEQPINILTLELFECAVCDVANKEREQVNLECLNAQLLIRTEH